jgi:hypothetical protein
MVIPPGQPNDSCCHHLTGTPLKVQAAFLPCITLDTCSAYRVAMSGSWVAHEWPMGLQSGPNWSALLHLLHLPDSKQLSWPQRLSTLAQIVLTSLSRANAKSEGRCTACPANKNKVQSSNHWIHRYQLPFLNDHTSHSTPFWEGGAHSTGGGCVGPSLKCWLPPTSLTDAHLRDDRWRLYEVQSLIGTRGEKKNTRWSVGLKSVACCQISALSCKVAKFQ